MITYEELYTPDTIKGLVELNVAVPAKEDFTCNGCPHASECSYAWDLYNTGNDCLADK